MPPNFSKVDLKDKKLCIFSTTVDEGRRFIEKHEINTTTIIVIQSTHFSFNKSLKSTWILSVLDSQLDIIKEIVEDLSLVFLNSQSEHSRLHNKIERLQKENSDLKRQNKLLEITSRSSNALEYELKVQTNKAQDLSERAQAANNSKSIFLANMSHEIRTPMNGVIGMINLVLDTELTEEQRQYIDTAKNSAESLLALINDILDFSKIEAGKLEIEEIDFDLRSMIDDFMATMSFKTEEKGLELLSAIDPNLPARFKGDPGRIRQILTNLTGNAIKFTEKGEVEIKVSLYKDNDNSSTIHFSIRDTGIGISKENQKNLFSLFTQADNSITRKFGGTGLGLSISKQLIELMNGHIEIDSIEGEGTTFLFTLELPHGAKKEPTPPLLGNLRGSRVLVIDDNHANLHIVNKMLSQWCINVTSVDNGKEGIDLLHQSYSNNKPFNIVIVDLVMPFMDGEEVCRIIREDENFKNIPVVLLTSVGVRNDATRFKKKGFNAYLNKPVRQQELHNTLAEIIGGNSNLRDNPQQKIITKHTIKEDQKARSKILLVEDNPINQLVAKSLIQKFGYSLDIAQNGLEALEKLKEYPYNLVFMDIQMPVMDGLEATAHIRDTKSAVQNHEIPIIAMTANAMKGDREKYLKAGMNDYISKPIDPDIVLRKLEQWILVPT